MRTKLSTLAAALLVIAPHLHAQAAPATAAAATSAATSATPAAAMGPALPWTKSAVGTYDLSVQTPEGAEVATLIVATDSAGALTAKVVEGPRNDEHPLQVTVKGNDLVCLSATNNGVMTITFQRYANGIVGKAIMGAQEATITGKLHS